MYNTHLYPSIVCYCIIYKDPSKSSTLQPGLYAYLMKTKCVLHTFPPVKNTSHFTEHVNSMTRCPVNASL